MVKGWQTTAKKQGGWGTTEEWPSESTWSKEEKPRPPQQPPPYSTHKGGWKKQLSQPGNGKGGQSIVETEMDEDLHEEMPAEEMVDETAEVDMPEEQAAEEEEWEQSASDSKATDLSAVQPRPGETEREAKVRAMAERIRAEARRAREQAVASAVPSQQQAKRKVPSTAAEKRKEEQDGQKFEEMLPKMEDKVSAAEDEVEKVAILAAPLSMEAVEELKELQMSAIRDTERAVKAALSTVGKARREMEMRNKEIEKMSPLVQESAREEFAKLLLRLDAAQAKLDEHKHVRKDHELSVQAEKLFGELASRLAGVEIDCEKAAMMSEPLAKALDTNPHEINTSEIRETKEALRIAQATMAPTMRLISGKVAGLKGAVRSKMLDLQSRAEASQALLDKAQRTVEEAQSRAAAIPILKQAQDRVATIEEVLQKMRETEAPFLMGIETMPPEEAGEVLARMDRAASLAQSALADATKYISLKAVEVGRLAEGAAESARRELDRVKQHLDEGIERVKKFQVEAAKRRRVNLVEVVKAKIEEAETAIAKMKEAGTELQTTETGSLAGALEKAHAAELEAQNAVTTARRELQEKQQDLRPLEGGHPDVLNSSSDILRTKVRVNLMETELTKFRKVAKEFEEKIKVGKSLTEVVESLKEAEEEVDRISTVSQDWPKDAQPPDEAQKSITVIQSKLSSTTVQVEMKLQTAQGLELKELRGIFGRLQKSQLKLDKVKELARERIRAISIRIAREAADAVKRAEAKVASLNIASASVRGISVSKLEALYQQALAAKDMIAEAKKVLTESHGLETQAKVEFARLHLRFKSVERKGKTAADTIAAQFERTASETSQQVLDALRSAARREDGTYDSESFFVELSDSTGEITEAQFCDFFTKHKNEFAISVDKVKLAFSRIAPHGLMRRTFVSALADFLKVVRDITITDEFEIHSAKKVRKLEVGEIIEALGETKVDGNLSLERVQCRAVRDGTMGWVTVRSTAGTSYLVRAQKPFLWCANTVTLRASTEAESTVVRELKPGEVLELVEGPREERLGSDLRVRGVSCTEESTGWLQVRDKGGNVLAKPSSAIYKCVEAIAMTDTSDFDNCTMVRRIDSGEALELIPHKEVQPGEGGTRRKFRACRDSAEGWVTVQGSQGTVYVKQAPKHYMCVQASPIHAGLGAESTVVRVLMPGEAFAAFEEPKEVAGGERLTSYSIRAVSDGKEGWVTSTAAEEIHVWSARYKVLKTVTLTKGFPANEAAEVIEVIRLLEPNEMLDVTEQPTEDTSSGQLRARCVALKDKAVGWATIREGTGAGSLLLRPATADELRAAEEPAAPGDFGEAAPTTPPAAAASSAPPKTLKRPWQVKQEPDPSQDPVAKSAHKGGKGGPSPLVGSAGAPPKRFKGKGKGHW